MARVTVEDCILKVENRFELVAYASQRARDIASGSPISIDRDNDKDSVVSLREIAKGTVQIEILKEEFIKSFQRSIDIDEIESNETTEASGFAPAQIAEEMQAMQITQAAQEEAEQDDGFSFAEEEIDAKD